MRMVVVTGARIIEGFVVELTFDDGAVKRVDLAPFLDGPVLQPLRDDPALFRGIAVDPALGTIAWPNGADLDPLVLRYDLPPESS
jgi:hypothetical protein